MKGIVFDIKRFAVHDGPGVRTTIFLKGCPLSCWWCHNPEGISPEIQTGDTTLKVGDHCYREKQIIGKPYSVEELIGEIEKDYLFYEESGGGVTLSGGEPLLQYGFASELLKACSERDIHSCVDTSGYVTPDNLRAITPFVGLFLFDVKFVDEKKHLNYTGVSNQLILQNLESLIIDRQEVIIRYPLIPGINDDPGELDAFHHFLDNRVQEIHFLPYHAISAGKWKRLGLENKMNRTKSMSPEEAITIKEKFTRLGYTVKIGG